MAAAAALAAELGVDGGGVVAAELVVVGGDYLDQAWTSAADRRFLFRDAPVVSWEQPY